MIVLENILVGADVQYSMGLVLLLFWLFWYCCEEVVGYEWVCELLKFMGLSRRADELVCNLLYGDQWCLEIVCVLAIEF